MATQEFFRSFTSVLYGFEQPNKLFHAFHQSASRVSFFQASAVTFQHGQFHDVKIYENKKRLALLSVIKSLVSCREINNFILYTGCTFCILSRALRAPAFQSAGPPVYYTGSNEPIVTAKN